jgi:hypothetical protein
MKIENNSNQCLAREFLENKLIRRIAFIFMVVVILFLAVWVKAFIGSMKNYNIGEEYFHNQQYIKAITFFDRSMHWYTPFSPYIERSAEYLWEISIQAEQINDAQLSLIALETIRNSFYSSRSFHSPGMVWLERCEDRIRNLTRDKNEEILGNDDADSENNVYESSMEYNDPNIFWVIVLEIGLFGWIGSVICFIFFYLGAENKSDRFIRSFWLWTLLMGINYAFWILGIIKA